MERQRKQQTLVDRFELLYRLYRSYRSNQGFTLPIALGLGFFIVILGLSMMLRSQGDSSMANAQKVGNRGVGATEIATARYQSLLAKYPALAAFPYCNTWSGTVGAATSTCSDTSNAAQPASWHNLAPIMNLLQQSAVGNACTPPNQIQQDIAVFTTSAWQNVATGDPRSGQFRIVNYTFTPAAQVAGQAYTGKEVRIGNGILTVEGRVELAANNDNDASTAQSQIQVQVPVTPIGTYSSFPGVWVRTGDTGGNNTMQANVVISDCNASLNNVNVAGTDPATGEPYKKFFSRATMPDVPADCQSTTYNSNVDSSVTCRPTSFATSNNLGDITTDIRLPRTGDSSELIYIPRLDANGNVVYNSGVPVLDQFRVFKYRVGNVTLNGSEEVVIQTGSQNIANLPSPPAKNPAPDSTQVPIKVYLYVDGNISMPGQAGITRKCVFTAAVDGFDATVPNCTATDLHIYGYNRNGNANPEMCMNGRGYIEGLILAPNYKVGVAGSGGGDGGVKGAVWANSWSTSGGCGSNTTNVVVDQRGGWVELAPFLRVTVARSPATIKPPGSWVRREFGTTAQ
uniref:Uncharacterized protein n=1 Tax=Cyanothece sp. (strain PCC 7425 / ATCC 29141) TaxID=395961 RepID=B8HQ02_CYAP4